MVQENEEIYYINGGFPPLKYCKKKTQNKERLFVTNIVDIKNILTKQTQTKLIDIDDNNNDEILEAV